MKKDIWNLMREASKKGWDGTITKYKQYCAPDTHLFGEHVFDAGGEDFGDYFYPEEPLPSYYEDLIKKAIKENYCWKDCFKQYKKYGRLDNE